MPGRARVQPRRHAVSSSPRRQITIELQIELLQPRPDAAPLCVAGNLPGLGDWQPASKRLERIDARHFRHRFTAPMGATVEFKVTRGSWKTQAIYDPPDEEYSPRNRTLVARRDVVVPVKVADWLDQLPIDPDPVLGDLRVHANFRCPGLHHDRDLLVWLPPSYARGNKRYPVLYMHDGQNLFDPATSFCGQDWKVDETAMRLWRTKSVQEFIVVGVPNSPDRMDEYNLFTPLGQAYASFLLGRVKPFVDRHYRTRPDVENTGVMGSSMGGLVSFQLAWAYPDVFGMAGCLSPAFWPSRSRQFAVVRRDPQPHKNVRFYLDAGELENSFVKSSEKMAAMLRSLGYRDGRDLMVHIAADANHSEAAWAERLDLPLRFFFGTRP